MKIYFEGREIECEHGENLRKVLLREGAQLYHSAIQPLHCRGLGTCGTCALEINGEISKPTAIEKWRLNFPPHKKESGLRLACQVKVLGDLEIKKHPGIWGDKKDQ